MKEKNKLVRVLKSHREEGLTSFNVGSGRIIYCEPGPPGFGARAVSKPLRARAGMWVAEVGLFASSGVSCVASLTLAHSSGFWGLPFQAAADDELPAALTTLKKLGTVNVEGGSFGVFDAEHLAHEQGASVLLGTNTSFVVAENSCMVSTGFGDGDYDVLGFYAGDELVALRVIFVRPDGAEEKAAEDELPEAAATVSEG
jgi:hypothetical protein